MTKKSYLTLLEVYAGIARGFWGCFGVRSPSRGPTERQSLKVPWDLLQSQKFCGKAHVRKGGALVTTQKALCGYIKYLHWEWSFFFTSAKLRLKAEYNFLLNQKYREQVQKDYFSASMALCHRIQSIFRGEFVVSHTRSGIETTILALILASWRPHWREKI